MKKEKLRVVIHGLAAVLTVALLTACSSEKKVDYIIEGEEFQEEESVTLIEGEAAQIADGGKIGLTQFEGEKEWKATLSTQFTEESGAGEVWEAYVDVRVDAEIIVPEVSQMSVVEVSETYFDATYKEALAKKLFETEEIYYGNAANLPRQDIEILWPSYEAGAYIYDTEPFNFAEWNSEWTDCYNAYQNLSELKDTYTPATDFAVNRYLGTYEDKMYSLTFIEDEPDRDHVYRLMKRVTFEAKDIYEVCPDKYVKQENLSYSPWMYGDWADNQCVISEEDALKEAKKFVDNLGIDTTVFAYSRPLAWGNVPEVLSITDTGEADDWGMNGYVFYFDLGIDGTSFMQYGTEDDYTFWSTENASDDDGEKIYSLRSQLQIYITDAGVIKMVIDNPVEITGVSENVELLPLDTIKEIIKRELNASWQVFRFKTYYPLDMNEMELIYFRVRDKEHPGQYSYVPTWRLATVMTEGIVHGVEIRNPIFINAIDGTVIDFYNET